MNLKVVSAIMLTLSLLCILALTFRIQLVEASGTIYIRADGSIEGTTNIATVDNVTYTFTNNNYEQIVVERDNIVVDGAGYVLQGAGSGTGIDLRWRNNVTLKNLEVTNFTRGIYLSYSNSNVLAGNIVANNYFGINLYSSGNNTLTGNSASNNHHGIYLEYFSRSNVLANNTVSNNIYEIYLYYSGNNTLIGNTVSDTFYGIYIHSSSNNVLANNTASTNNPLYDYFGIRLHGSSNNTLTSNTASNMLHGIYLISSNNNTLTGNVASNNDQSGIKLISSKNNVLTGNSVFSNHENGIMLSASSNNNLIGNSVSDNNFGISIHSSSNNVLTGNSVSSNNANGINILDSSVTNTLIGNSVSNNYFGIRVYSSSNNTFNHNSFINNTFPRSTDTSPNTWDDGYPSGGNYWSDYTGVDVKSGLNQDQPSSDGIGDTALVIDGYNQDRYPLMKPYAGPHDLGIGVSTSKTVVAEGYDVTVTTNLTIINYGEQTETFNITFQINAPVQEQTLTLTSRNSTTITCTWNTTGLPRSNYTFSANITIVSGETDTSDNTYSGWFLITIPGDLDGDRDVDVGDQREVQIAIFSYPGDPNWDPNADIDCDLNVDVGDQRIQQNNMFESW